MLEKFEPPLKKEIAPIVPFENGQTDERIVEETVSNLEEGRREKGEGGRGKEEVSE